LFCHFVAICIFFLVELRIFCRSGCVHLDASFGLCVSLIFVDVLHWFAVMCWRHLHFVQFVITVEILKLCFLLIVLRAVYVIPAGGHLC
jgi:hypothetical protein